MKGGLHNIWIRIIVCALAGGMSQELMHISTGDPNRPETGNYSLWFGFGYFLLITAILKTKKSSTRKNLDICDIGKE